MKTSEEVIQDEIGIKPGAKDLTPMDYGEAKRCMKSYSDQQLAAFKEKLKKEIIDGFDGMIIDEIIDLIDNI